MLPSMAVGPMNAMLSGARLLSIAIAAFKRIGHLHAPGGAD